MYIQVSVVAMGHSGFDKVVSGERPLPFELLLTHFKH